MNKADKDIIINQLKESGRSANVFQPDSDAYLQFLVKELKSYIDNQYSVYKDPKHTC